LSQNEWGVCLIKRSLCPRGANGGLHIFWRDRVLSLKIREKLKPDLTTHVFWGAGVLLNWV